MKKLLLLAFTLLLSCCRSDDFFNPETGTGSTLLIYNTDKSTFMKYATQGVWQRRREVYIIWNMEVTSNAYKNLELEPSTILGVGPGPMAILDENRVKKFIIVTYPFEQYSTIYQSGYNPDTRELTIRYSNGEVYEKWIVISINEHYMYCIKPAGPQVSPYLKKDMGTLYVFEQTGTERLAEMEKLYPLRN